MRPAYIAGRFCVIDKINYAPSGVRGKGVLRVNTRSGGLGMVHNGNCKTFVYESFDNNFRP